MLYDNLAILDVETTGAAPPFDRIIEIGIAKIEKNSITKTFETLINPDISISPFIENLTGINSSELESAPRFSDVRDEIVELLDGCVFVAHNARFDYSFIRNEFKRIGIPYKARQLCTVKLSRLLYPNFRHHNLDSIIERFDIECKRRHRALDDALVIWDFLQKIKYGVDEKRIDNAFKTILKKPSLPSQLTQKDIDSLPEKAGVYLFYGKSDIPLYIGKSINIKDRVLSHFINDMESTTEMEITQQIERIETIVTGGELSALLLESELIKKMQPLYNRKLRNARKMVILKKKVTKDGYFSLDIVNGEEIQEYELENVLGIFKSQKSAKSHLSHIAKEHTLCQKLLGLQKISGPCFNFHLEICKGACVMKEDAGKYNARFILAFAKTKISNWPFNGPIIVREAKEDFEEAMIFDKWCYLGKYNEYVYEEGKETLLTDFDVYKILRSFVKDPGNFKKITTVKDMTDVTKLQSLF